MSSTFILTNDGLFVCGYNGLHQLGLGHKNRILIPTKVDVDDIIEVIYNENTILVTSNGEIYVVGGYYNIAGVPKLENYRVLTKLDIPPIKFKNHKADIVRRDSYAVFNTIDGYYVWTYSSRVMGLITRYPAKIVTNVEIYELHIGEKLSVLNTSAGIFVKEPRYISFYYLSGMRYSSRTPLKIPKVKSVHMGKNILFNTEDGLYCYRKTTHVDYELVKIDIPPIIEVCYHGDKSIVNTVGGIYTWIDSEPVLLDVPKVLFASCTDSSEIYNTINGIYVRGRNKRKKLLDVLDEEIPHLTHINLPEVTKIHNMSSYVIYETIEGIYMSKHGKIEDVHHIIANGNFAIFYTTTGIRLLGFMNNKI